MSDSSHYTYRFIFDNRFRLDGNSVAHLWYNIYDAFDDHNEMYVERIDGKEMNQKEIRDLRKDLFEVMDQDELIIDSQYKSKRLHFWNRGFFWPRSHEEYVDCIINLFEDMDYYLIDICDQPHYDFIVQSGNTKKAVLWQDWNEDEENEKADQEMKDFLHNFLSETHEEHQKVIVSFEDFFVYFKETIGDRAECISWGDIRNKRNWYIAKILDEETRDPYYVYEENYDEHLLELLLKTKKSQTNKQKMQTMEDLGAYVFDGIDGFHVEKRNLRGFAEEIDLLISNERNDVFFEKLGSPLIVECRNRETPFSAPDMSVFITKIKDLGLKSGFILCKKGLTGTPYSDAKLKIRESLKEGITIIPLELQDIRYISQGADPTRIIKKKFYDLFER